MTTLSFFAGANTARGFFSYYDDLARECMNRVFILKGGPGTGKSTLIKNIAAKMQAEYDLDKYYCSADVHSLDGIHIRGLEVALLDGTAPHCLEPRLPGAVHELVDLGACWQSQGLIENRNIISKLQEQIKKKYMIAYKWLEVAAGLADLMQTLERPPLEVAQAKAEAAKIAEFLPAEAWGKSKRAFASAITANGLKSFLPELQAHSPCNVYLAGGNRVYNGYVLEKIKQTIEDRNIGAMFLYCGFLPRHLEHIYIPDQLGIFSVHRPHLLPVEENIFGFTEKEPSPLEEQIVTVIAQAVSILATARSLHLELEKVYYPYIDFGAVQAREQQIFETITRQ